MQNDYKYMGIYAGAVCFVCAIVFSIALAKSIYNGVEIAAPRFTLTKWNYECLQSNLRFVQARCDWPEHQTPPAAAELTALREQHLQIALAAERRSGAQGIVNSLILMGVSALVFFLHWRCIQCQRAPAKKRR